MKYNSPKKKKRIMNLLGTMDSTGQDHMLHPAQRRQRLFRVFLVGSHDEENETGMREALVIAKKALTDRGYTVAVDRSDWDFGRAEDAVVRVRWWSRLVAWVRGLWA